MNRCVEQANLETLVSTSTTPTRLHDKGFYVKTKDGQVHHLRVGVLYIATTYAADGKREHHLRVQPAEYRFPLWINIPKAAALFKAFTSNLDKPTLERVAKTMPGDNGIKSTTYWGVFGGAYHYTKHLLKCATDETTGNVIPFKLFCDRWIEVAQDSTTRKLSQEIGPTHTHSTSHGTVGIHLQRGCRAEWHKRWRHRSARSLRDGQKAVDFGCKFPNK